GVELLERARGVARDELVEHVGVAEHGAQELAKIEAIGFRELRLALVLRRKLVEAVARELRLIQRLYEQLAAQLPRTRSVAARAVAAAAALAVPAAAVVTRFGQAQCSRCFSALAICTAASAASAPLLPAFVPARSTACSIVSTVNRPKPIGISWSMLTAPMPRVASPAT